METSIDKFLGEKHPDILAEYERFKFFAENILPVHCLVETIEQHHPFLITGYYDLTGVFHNWSLYPSHDIGLVSYRLETQDPLPKGRIKVEFEKMYKTFQPIKKPVEIGDVFYWPGSKDATFRLDHFVKKGITSRTGWTWYEFTDRENATHVWGSGVCGCNAPIGEIYYVRTVSWDLQRIKEHQEEHNQKIGKRVMV